MECLNGRNASIHHNCCTTIVCEITTAATMQPISIKHYWLQCGRNERGQASNSLLQYSLKMASSSTCGISEVRRLSVLTGRTILIALMVSSSSSTRLTRSAYRKPLTNLRNLWVRRHWLNVLSLCSLTNKILTWLSEPMKFWRPLSFQASRIDSGRFRPARL